MGEQNEIKLRAAPSKEAIVKLLRNEPNGFRDVLLTLVGRSVLIAAGIRLFGEKDKLWKNSFAAALTIELYLLWHYSRQLEKRK